jgi:hypothetical protein
MVVSFVSYRLNANPDSLMATITWVSVRPDVFSLAKRRRQAECNDHRQRLACYRLVATDSHPGHDSNLAFGIQPGHFPAGWRNKSI